MSELFCRQFETYLFCSSSTIARYLFFFSLENLHVIDNCVNSKHSLRLELRECGAHQQGICSFIKTPKRTWMNEYASLLWVRPWFLALFLFCWVNKLWVFARYRTLTLAVSEFLSSIVVWRLRRVIIASFHMQKLFLCLWMHQFG